MLSLIKNQEKSRARGMGEAMSFDEQEDPLSDCMEHAEKMAKEIESLKATAAGKDKELFDVREAAEIVSVMDGKRIAMLIKDLKLAEFFINEDSRSDSMYVDSEALTANPSEVDDWWKLELGKAGRLEFQKGIGFAKTIMREELCNHGVLADDLSHRINQAYEVESNESHTPKPDEPHPPSKEWSDG